MSEVRTFLISESVTIPKTVLLPLFIYDNAIHLKHKSLKGRDQLLGIFFDYLQGLCIVRCCLSAEDGVYRVNARRTLKYLFLSTIIALVKRNSGGAFLQIISSDNKQIKARKNVFLCSPERC